MIIFSADISLNELDFSPHSGVNVASDNNEPILIKGYFPATREVQR